MTIAQRIDARWNNEVQALLQAQAHSNGRLRVLQHSQCSVRVGLDVIAAFLREQEEPVIAQAEHVILLDRNSAWPACRIEAIHQGPAGVFHPNIQAAYDGRRTGTVQDAAQQIMGAFSPGVICYADVWQPQLSLKDIVVQIALMLGYQYRRFSTQGTHMNARAVRWANAHPELFPLDCRPLFAAQGGRQ